MTMSFKEAARYAKDMHKRLRRPEWPIEAFLMFVPAMTDIVPDGLFIFDGKTHKLLSFMHSNDDTTASDWLAIGRMAPDHPDFDERQHAEDSAAIHAESARDDDPVETSTPDDEPARASE